MRIITGIELRLGKSFSRLPLDWMSQEKLLRQHQQKDDSDELVVINESISIWRYEKFSSRVSKVNRFSEKPAQ